MIAIIDYDAGNIKSVEKRKHFATVCFWGILYCSVLIGYFIPV